MGRVGLLALCGHSVALADGGSEVTLESRSSQKLEEEDMRRESTQSHGMFFWDQPGVMYFASAYISKVRFQGHT